MSISDLDPRSLLPHGPEMHYVERLVEWDDQHCLCTARFDEANPFARHGKVSAYVAMEALAQASAIHEALGRIERDGQPPDGFAPRIGFLVSASDLVFSTEEIPVEVDFLVRVTVKSQKGPLAEYEIEARADDHVYVAGTMKTYAT